MLPNLTLVIQGLAFFSVAWLVMKFGWPHIMNAIEARQAKIADGIAAAERSQKTLAQTEDQVAEVLRDARTRANDIIDQAHNRANQLVDQAKEEAIAVANRQTALAADEISAATNRAREALRGQLATLAVAGAEKLIRREIDAGTHKVLLDELAAQL